MQLSMFLAPFIMMLGFVLYWWGARLSAKWPRLGEIMFFAGLFVWLLSMMSSQATASFKIH